MNPQHVLVPSIAFCAFKAAVPDAMLRSSLPLGTSRPPPWPCWPVFTSLGQATVRVLPRGRS